MARANCQLSRNIATKGAAQQQNIRGEFDQTIGQGTIDGLRVIGDPAHQVADLIAVVEDHRHFLNVAEQAGADIGNEALAKYNHDKTLHHRRGPCGEINKK